MTSALSAFIAPFFVAFESLNFLFGYKKTLLKECNQVILQDIAFYRSNRKIPMIDGYTIK
tara:strand:+ start:260 stop:439 length:180 start_codon:yes stop_codon:yes gene_type:complete